MSRCNIGIIKAQLAASCDQYEEPPSTRHIIPNINTDFQVEVVSDLDVCKRLFNIFSPKDSLFSTWNFRFAWFKPGITKPFFFLFLQNQKPKALLPLWFDANRERFEWFGSDWQENNSFWTLDKSLISLMLDVAPKKTYLNAIRTNDESLIKLLNLQPDDPKFELDLTNLKTSDDFLARFDKKKRYNLKRDRQDLIDQGIEIIYNRFEDIHELIRFANCRFNDQSLWTPHIVTAFENLVKNQTNEYQMEMLSFKVGHMMAGYDLNFIYNKTYSAVKCGYNVQTFPGIGNFATLTDIDQALKHGCTKMDFLQSVGALTTRPWKADWFTTIPLYKIEK